MSKKLTFVIYYDNNNQYDVLKSITSITNDEVEPLLYDIFVISDFDFENNNTSSLINEFISKNKFLNIKLVTFGRRLGINGAFNFINKGNKIKSKYVTFLKAGDVVKEGWLNLFVENYYSLDYDFYFSQLKLKQIITKNKISKKENKVVSSKTITKIRKYKPFGQTKGLLSKKSVRSTESFFLGKIFKYEKIKNIAVDQNKIEFQEISLYQRIISACDSFYYINKVYGSLSYSSWTEKLINKDYIDVFSSMLDGLVSVNDRTLNGHVTRLLAVAISSSDKNYEVYYKISPTNAKILKEYNKIYKSSDYQLKRSKIKKMSSNVLKRNLKYTR